MKKASGAKHIARRTPCTLAVNNTFEHSLRVKYDLPFQCYHANLSRQLCLYLVHLGVPKLRFEVLMQDELNRVLNAIHDKAAAKSLIMRSLERFEFAIQQNGISSDDEENDDELLDQDGVGDDNFYPLKGSCDESSLPRYLSALHSRATERYVTILSSCKLDSNAS